MKRATEKKVSGCLKKGLNLIKACLIPAFAITLPFWPQNASADPPKGAKFTLLWSDDFNGKFLGSRSDYSGLSKPYNSQS
jgi:hypothetical protein